MTISTVGLGPLTREIAQAVNQQTPPETPSKPVALCTSLLALANTYDELVVARCTLGAHDPESEHEWVPL